MNSLPNSLPPNIQVSFFQYQRKEWEKVLESFKNNQVETNQSDHGQHWESVNKYALAKIQEIDKQLERLNTKGE